MKQTYWMLNFVLSFLFLTFAESGRVTAKHYCKPSDSCWPTSDELKDFSYKIQGNVATPTSPGYHDESLINNRRFIVHPGVIIEVHTINDVVLSLKFAHDHNIRVSILSTDHDYDGRDSGNDTLQLSFMTMKRKNIVEYGEKRIQAIRVETGNTWTDVHHFMLANRMSNKVVVGATDPGEGVAGWVLSGGHSLLSSMAGLGADNVLAFDMVLANGSVVTADEDQNSELFWALRGGGGGTFGVITNITFRLHDDPQPVVGLVAVLSITDSKIFGNYLSRASSNVSGLFSIEIGTATAAKCVVTLLYRGSYANALREFMPVMNLDFESTLTNFTNVYSYYDFIPVTSFLGVSGQSNYIFNTFLSDESVATGDSLAVAFQYVVNNQFHVKTQESRACAGVLLGGAVSTAIKTSGATAVNPAFRNACLSLSCGSTWKQPGPYPKDENLADEWASKLYKYGDGTYISEPQSNLIDWKIAFWGSHKTYDRLLKIKKEVDPDFLFNCHHCVGYEDETHIS